MIKKAAFAGSFYPQDYTDLSNLIESFAAEKVIRPQEKALGLLVPHAAYFCSGKIAYQTLMSFKLPDTIVILGTHHSFEGAAFATSQADGWQTPFGISQIDSDFVKNLSQKSKFVKVDENAFRQEHSVEIQIPLLQYIKRKFSFIPLLVSEADTDVYQEIASDIISTAQTLKKDIVIIASGDLTHYESQTQAEYKDAQAIKAILELSPEKLIKTRDELKISMCAGAPAATMLYGCLKLKAQKAELVAYDTSGAVTNDFMAVVGYAGIGIY
jgi:hypothetical protein